MATIGRVPRGRIASGAPFTTIKSANALIQIVESATPAIHQVREPQDVNASRIHHRFNVKAAVILAALTLVACLSLFLFWSRQEDRVLQKAIEQIKTLQVAGDKATDPQERGRYYDLALRHLNQYLSSRPDDTEALQIQARLMTTTVQSPLDLLGIASIFEHLLQVEPEGPRAQEARRHLTAIYIQYSDAYRGSAQAQVMPEETAKNLRYHVAELRADQLLDPKSKPRVDDAEAHRLRAMALERQIAASKDSRLVDVYVHGQLRRGLNIEEAAILEYENALERDPSDLFAARGLAGLYVKARKDKDAAQRVLDRLLETRKGAVEVRLIRYQFAKSMGDVVAANNELIEAEKKSPGNLLLIQMGVADALQSGRKDGTTEARGWLARVPEKDRENLRVLTMKGYIEYSERHPADAVSTWRSGLIKAEGSDAELNWQLALVLLELGRDEEAAPYVAQFRRISGAETPLLGLLEALQEEHAGRYSRAIQRLETVKDRIGAGFQTKIRVMIGRCQEKLGDRVEAEKTLRAALQSDPRALISRLALAHLLLGKGQPDDASLLLEQGLKAFPDQPELLITLAEARLKIQLVRPRERRNWSAFDTAFAKAAEQAEVRMQPVLALIQAERLAAEGGTDQAVGLLRQYSEKGLNSPELAIGLAEGLISQGRPDQALQIIERAAEPKAAGDRGSLRVERARILTTLGRGREARNVLLNAVNRLPIGEREEVWRALLLLCRAQADPDTSRATFDAWLRLVPGDPQPKLALFDMAIEANDPKAIATALAALKPTDPRDRDDRNWLLAQARERLWKRSLPATSATEKAALLKEADTLVETVLRDTKVDSVALVVQGQILDESGDRSRAVDSYSRAWAHGNAAALPRLVDLLTKLGRKDELQRLRQADASRQVERIEAVSFLRNGDKNEAVRLIEQSLRDEPGARPWQIGMLSALGDQAKVEESLRAGAQRQPDRFESWQPLLEFLVSHKRTDDIAATVAEIKKQVKTDRPDLLDARCRWTIADRSGADKAYDDALRKTPDDVRVLQTVAQYYQATGRSEHAEECLRHLLEIDPKQRSAVRQLAMNLSARSETWAQALTILGPEKPNSEVPEERLARGVVLARSADPAKRQHAVEILDALVADLPAGANLAVMGREVLTRLLLGLGQAERASRIAAVSATSGFDSAAIALYAEALLQSGQLDVADEQIKRLATLGDTASALEANLRARLIQARAQAENVQPNTAAATLEQTYLAGADSPGGEIFGREAFPIVLAMGPGVAAVAERMGQRLAENNPALSWMPALFLARRGQRDQALALCRTAIRESKSPTDRREAARIALEIAVTALNDPGILTQATEVLDNALSHDPNADELLVMKAIVCHLQGRFEEEVRVYRSVLKRQPRNTVVLNNMAWALSEGLNHPSEALEKIDELIKIAGRNAEYLDTKGMILLRIGRLEQAVEDLEEAVKLEPNSTHHYHLAQAYKKLGRETDFRKSLDEARRAGLSPTTIDPVERAEVEALIKL